MNKKQIHAVTGAFGYSGKYIARRLLDKGHKVITLTNSGRRPNPFGDKLQAFAFNFDYPQKLVETLKGVSVLYVTYWVRFNHKMFTHADAVRNTTILFESAAKAGVERIIYVSITNPSENSHLEYFSGKGKLENILKSLTASYSILRPAVLFGKEDILINNIISTGIGVEFSARDAARRGSRSGVVWDCVSSSDRDVHARCLKNMTRLLPAADSAEVMAAIPCSG